MSTRFIRIGNEIWERQGLSEKRVCTCEGGGRAMAVLEAMQATYDIPELGAGRARQNASEPADAASPGAPALPDPLVRIADVLEAWASGHFNYYPPRDRT